MNLLHIQPGSKIPGYFMHIYFPDFFQAQRYCGILWFLKTFSVEKIVGMARKIMRELTLLCKKLTFYFKSDSLTALEGA